MTQPPVLDLGSMSVTWLCGGYNQLDGGTMFGAVPKILWSRQCPPDADNYFDLINNPLLVRTPHANIIIDTGLGNKLTEKQKKIFRVTREWAVIEELRAVGLQREDIDAVIFTHGDFDHAGGAVMVMDDGSYEPTYPNARYILQQKEWEDISAPNIRAAHTYFPVNFAELEQRGKLELVDGDREVIPGVTVRLSGGHTRGHQIIAMEGSEGCAVHMGDLFPTHHHSNPLWVMAYDNFPLDVIERKVDYFKEYSEKKCWFTFYHDFDMRACRLDAAHTLIDTFGGSSKTR